MTTGEEWPPGTEPRHPQLEGHLTEELEHAKGLGFLGPMPAAEQLEHALGFVGVIESELGRAPGSVLDLGSGGGPPGLVLAACWPTTRAVLVEANHRRAEFLQHSLARLGVAESAEVATGRAESLGHQPDLREAFECVTGRSFGRPAVTAECGSAFLSLDGRLVASEPPDAVSDDDRWPSAGLALLGLVRPRMVRFGRFGYRVVDKASAIAARYPRRLGIPAKRPLF
jgi:16S rRNA (guanine527-N7)-methyltransferase